ncbi:MAG TPA: MFS transporter [Caulobacteraceae bacterium]|nr:MFS transporter [Caulobacteraceae bacterium]
MPALGRAPFALAAALTFVRFADEWTTYLPAGAFEPIRSELAVRYVEASAPLVALSAGGLVGAGLVVAADYVSRRWLSALGALAYAISMIAFGLSHSIWVMVAAAFVWGAASDAFVHGAEVALVDLAGDALPAALAKMSTWASVGDLLGPITLAVTSALLVGWRGAFIGLGVMMLGYAALLASQRFPPPHAAEHKPRPFVGVLAALADRDVLLLAVAMGLFSLLDEPLIAFLIAFQEQVRHRTAAIANGLILAWTLGEIAGFALYERIVGERGLKTVLVSGALVVGGALATAVIAPVLLVELPAMALFGAAAAVFYVTLDARILSLRPGQTGSLSAAVSLVGMVGMGFPAVVGAVSDAFGLAAGLSLYLVVPVIILPLVARNWR